MMIQALLLSLLPISAMATNPVIYDVDNRVDTINSSSPLFKRLAASTAAQISKRYIKVQGSKAQFQNMSLNDLLSMGGNASLCEDEPFRNQVAVGNCSGFLVAPDIIVTAGHCYNGNQCDNFDWVFNYKIASSGATSVTVREEDIYSCEQVLKLENPFKKGDKDFAIIKLDRPVKGVTSLKIAKKTPGKGTPLVVIGYPSGLPQKIADGASIRKKTKNGFIADLDAFRGNSGSAVFDVSSGEVVGILVNGADDWSFDGENMCMRAAKLPSSKAGEGVSGVEQFLPYLK